MNRHYGIVPKLGKLCFRNLMLESAPLLAIKLSLGCLATHSIASSNFLRFAFKKQTNNK